MTDEKPSLNRDEAKALFQQLREHAAAEPHDETDKSGDKWAEAVTYDNEQYLVLVHPADRRSFALEPDEARWFAEELLTAADKADRGVVDRDVEQYLSGDDHESEKTPREYRIIADEKPGSLRHALRKQEPDQFPASLRNAAQKSRLSNGTPSAVVAIALSSAMV
jgi:hypothetical protein